MKKNKIILTIVTAISFIISLILLILLKLKNIPILAGIKDEIILVVPKWCFLIAIFLPPIFLCLYLLIKNKNAKYIFSALTIFAIYCNMLAFSYYYAGVNLELGNISEVPLSIAIFLPASLAIFVYGVIIKNISYKNKLGLISKNTIKTEFIWNQIHINASYYFRLTGVILFFISIILTFFHIPLIELILFIIIILTTRIILEVQASKMAKKYQDMKTKFDNIKPKSESREQK